MFITFEAEITPAGSIQLPDKYRNLKDHRVSVIITDEPVDVLRKTQKEKIMKYAGLWNDLSDVDLADMFPRTQMSARDGVIVDEKENT